jgi:hypothetical protein
VRSLAFPSPRANSSDTLILIALRSLVICGKGTCLVPLSSLLAFPALEEFSFSAATICDHQFFLSFPAPSSTPRLRGLAIGGAFSPDSGRLSILQDLSKPLLRQLDVLNVDTSDGYLNVYSTSELPPSNLVLDSRLVQGADCLFKNTAALPPCLRLYHGRTDFDPKTYSEMFGPQCVYTFKTLAGRLNDPSVPRAKMTLILPLDLGEKIDGSRELGDLVKVVWRSGGRVVREVQAHWDYESLISSAGWRWARQVKAEASR